MKNKFTLLAVSSLFALSTISKEAFADPKVPSTYPSYSTIQIMEIGQPKDVYWISVKQIAEKYKDISTPGLYRGKQEFSPNRFSYLHEQKFWDKIKCE